MANCPVLEQLTGATTLLPPTHDSTMTKKKENKKGKFDEQLVRNSLPPLHFRAIQYYMMAVLVCQSKAN
jgi:hypothetical protein